MSLRSLRPLLPLDNIFDNPTLRKRPRNSEYLEEAFFDREDEIKTIYKFYFFNYIAKPRDMMNFVHINQTFGMGKV